MEKSDYNVLDQLSDIAESALDEMREETVARAKDYWRTNILGLPSQAATPAPAAPTAAAQAKNFLQGNALYIIAGLIGLVILALFARK